MKQKEDTLSPELFARDFRLKENRMDYFVELYKMNLDHQIMPGLVYLYLPELASRYGWNDEQKLWFATINGCTQNPITSMRIFNKYPEIPGAGPKWMAMDEWFNAEWAELQFDSDRLKNKRNTVKALHSYSKLVRVAGSQAALWAGKTYKECWDTANSIFSFGRLSTFSYLEYVFIMGHGAECDDLMFGDLEGSRSHRNGALFLNGLDELVYDKRADNGFNGVYDDMPAMASWLNLKSYEVVSKVVSKIENRKDANYFTLESQYCQFKNGFFKRRYPGVYADMAYERIEWYDALGYKKETEVFKDIRTENLPRWLLVEASPKPLPRAKRAAMFAETGVPFRALHFMMDLV
jgi:hypothetical protein